MNGKLFFEAIKRINPKAKVCLMTGDVGEHSAEIEDMMRNGVKRLIRKPFRLDEFKEMIASVLSEKTE